MTNLSDTLPAAPSGAQNVKWQNDASGNTSAYVGAPGTRKASVTPSGGVVTLDCSLYDSFLVNVTSTVTSMVLTGGVDGQEITILWAQDTTGHPVTKPTSAPYLLGPFTINSAANSHTCFKFTYNSADTNFYQIGANSGM